MLPVIILPFQLCPSSYQQNTSSDAYEAQVHENLVLAELLLWLDFPRQLSISVCLVVGNDARSFVQPAFLLLVSP